MTSFLIICVWAFISVTVFYLVTRIALLHGKCICQRAVEDVELSKDIVLLMRRVSEEKELLKKYSRVSKYLQGVDYIFRKKFFDHRTVRVIRERANNREALLKDYEKAPESIKELVQNYSLILDKIYKVNHPIKWKLNQIWIRYERLFLLRILIPILERQLIRIKVKRRSRKRKYIYESAAKRANYRGHISMEPGRMNVSA